MKMSTDTVTFSQPVRKIHRELTREEYKMLKKLSYNDQHKWLFPDGTPQRWVDYFGYYGHDFKKKDGHYFAVFFIGGTK